MNKDFVENVISHKGAIGKKWLDSIPGLIKKYEEKYKIKTLQPFQLSYNYVTPAVREDGMQVVLKICLPDGDDVFGAEIEKEALRIINGDGMIQLLEWDKKDSVMLLEKAEPGVPISSLDDDKQATIIIASVMKKLWKPLPKNHSFPKLRRWMQGFERLRKTYNGTTGPLPEKIISEGEELYKYLINTSKEEYLLHGDLHHDNILSSKRDGWLAIDPQPIVGERAHDTAACLRNPQSKLFKFSNPKEVLTRRIHILSEELDLDKERIRQWGVAQNTLSAIWKWEDHGKDWDHSVKVAELLSELKV